VGHSWTPIRSTAMRSIVSPSTAVCAAYHTLRLGGWCILIDELPGGWPKPPGRTGSKGAVGRHSINSVALTITQLRLVGALRAVDVRAVVVGHPGIT